ncbi:helix-turn-helix domain-containing protein [Corynebacterium stationis]|uniref:helix-turn-helix domain-containing protein n=1 Tax=Corynebacterium stationis TaxID=1705 RepID=UPI0028A60951|nr:helix-turn-helix transcriptional regulator [Corynebacterium stationis]
MSIWDHIADASGEAENLKVRAEFMLAIRDEISKRGWSQADAVAHLWLTQPRVSALLNGKISQFRLDALANIGAKIGVRAEVVVDP